MPVVAAPAAIIGVAAAIWYLIALLLGQNWIEGAQAIDVTSGAVLGIATVVLLTTINQAPVAPVFGPPWRHSVLLGAVYAPAFWFATAPGFGQVGAWLLGIAGGAAATMATRRTVIDRTAKRLHRWLVGIYLTTLAAEVIIAYVIDERPFAGAGLVIGVAAGLVVPAQNFPKWTARLLAPLPAIKLRPAKTKNLSSLIGYQAEALALATFLAPVDIPRSLVIQAVAETGPGAAPGLKSLAANALVESGGDSYSLEPLVQRFAYQRLARGERRAWAGRAVRMLAARFPGDYTSNPHWCERLTPHALIAANHAQQLNVEPGAAALLLNQVAGYLAHTGRDAEAGRALEQALSCATIAFGSGSAEAATVRANLAQIGSQPARLDPARALEERHLLASGLAVIVVIVGLVAGVVVWRQATVSSPKPSGERLTTAADLRSLCAERPRYFPDAAAYSGAGPHPVRVFSRHAHQSGYQLEPLFDPSGPIPPSWAPDGQPVRGVQLVACSTWRASGSEITMCRYPSVDIPLHQATYTVTLFEAASGRTVAEQSLTLAEATCPAQLVEPAGNRPWRLYAIPAFDDYRRAIGSYIEETTNGAG